MGVDDGEDEGPVGPHRDGNNQRPCHDHRRCRRRLRALLVDLNHRLMQHIVDIHRRIRRHPQETAGGPEGFGHAERSQGRLERERAVFQLEAREVRDDVRPPRRLRQLRQPVHDLGCRLQALATLGRGEDDRSREAARAVREEHHLGLVRLGEEGPLVAPLHQHALRLRPVEGAERGLFRVLPLERAGPCRLEVDRVHDRRRARGVRREH
mmetsp:Transcript_27175/g.56464  ORF Transcript_27175/g.56464 Transcript_27175/m.56464 type:complete len:210 (+) Transcript_27175:276-905(+)